MDEIAQRKRFSRNRGHKKTENEVDEWVFSRLKNETTQRCWNSVPGILQTYPELRDAINGLLAQVERTEESGAGEAQVPFTDFAKRRIENLREIS